MTLHAGFLRFSSSVLLGAAGLLLAALTIGVIVLRPMSVNFFHYLSWRLTSGVKTAHGSVAAGEARIHYVCYGSGPAVMLLHGGMSNRLSWFSQIPWLAASGRQVVVLDTRGHGDSTLGSAELTYRLLASDAVAVLDHLHIHKADVIGWSDGGNTALMMGLYWPRRVDRLVAISANYHPSGLTAQTRQATDEKTSGIRSWFSRWWTGAGNHLAELEKRIKNMWRTRPNLQPVDLHAIEAPTLVIVGEADDVMIAHARQMAESLPHGRLEIIPGGHFTPLTHPGLVNGLIAAFLGDKPPNMPL
jgi:pimeloyl-ACP methyl ester carboxylesterase